jgi:NAD(P)H-dependent FMN reductase
MGSSPGRFGGSRAQEQVRMVLTAIGADVLDRELAMANVHESLAEDGTVSDPEVTARLGDFVDALVELAGGPAPPEPRESADYSRSCQEQAAAAG